VDGQKEAVQNEFYQGIYLKIHRKSQNQKRVYFLFDYLFDLQLQSFELKSEEETFSVPEWVDQEITDQDKYYNMNLITKPFKNWP
tara:strand:- start:312 stop:566 length:255 start_codon:yes stop_codon:yes gene_type:complete